MAFGGADIATMVGDSRLLHPIGCLSGTFFHDLDWTVMGFQLPDLTGVRPTAYVHYDT